MIRYPRILISSFDLLAFSCLLCLFLFCVYCSSLFPHSKLLVFVSSLLFPHFCLGGPCLLTVSTPSPTTHPPLHLALQRWVRSCCLSRLPRPLNAPAAVKLSLGEDLGPGGDVRTPPQPPACSPQLGPTAHTKHTQWPWRQPGNPCVVNRGPDTKATRCHCGRLVKPGWENRTEGRRCFTCPFIRHHGSSVFLLPLVFILCRHWTVGESEKEDPYSPTAYAFSTLP